MTDSMSIGEQDVAKVADAVVEEVHPLQKVLDELKKLCIEGETEAEHLAHALKLEEAYKAFANRDVSNGPSNPAPEGETGITAAVVATGDAAV